VNLPAAIDCPLSIPEIVDRSVTLAVRRWRTLLVLVLIEAVPIGILRAFVPERPMSLTLLWLVPDVIFVALLSGAVVLTVAATVAIPSAGTALRTAAHRFGAVLGTLLLGWALQVLIAALAFVVAVLIGMPFAIMGPIGAVAIGAGAALIGFLAVFPGVCLVSAIAVPIVVLERVSPWKGFTIAFRRVGNAGWRRAWLLGLSLFAVTVAPALLIGFGMETLIEVTGLSALKFAEELLTDVVTLGFGMVVGTVMSIEMRVRYEGADLEAVIDQVGASTLSGHVNGGASSAPVSSSGSE